MDCPAQPVLPPDWSLDAETHDFDKTKVWSCFHYIAENSYGINTTHPKYDEATWLKPLVDEATEFHGPAAMRTIQALVDLVGMAGYYFEPEHPDATSANLLRVAMVQSEFHRGIRK